MICCVSATNRLQFVNSMCFISIKVLSESEPAAQTEASAWKRPGVEKFSEDNKVSAPWFSSEGLKMSLSSRKWRGSEQEVKRKWASPLPSAAGSERGHQQLHPVDEVASLHAAPVHLAARTPQLAPLGLLHHVALQRLLAVAAGELHRHPAAALRPVTNWPIRNTHTHSVVPPNIWH